MSDIKKFINTNSIISSALRGEGNGLFDRQEKLIEHGVCNNLENARIMATSIDGTSNVDLYKIA